MTTHTYKMSGTCAKSLTFDLDGNIIRNIRFERGCNGNLNGISKLCDGLSADEIITKLSGLTCDEKSTSCPDQLAKAVKAAFEAAKAEA